eukprot:7741821-Karenia_brevis.AAC.1
MVQRCIQQSVWRWRWRRLEDRHSHIRQGQGGHGLFIQPLFRLINGPDDEEWGPVQRGALRSAVANRQYPQTVSYTHLRAHETLSDL